MLIVIDTTMIFSLLLGKNAKMRDAFFDLENHFYAPNYVIGKIFEKKEKILRYSALPEAELYELLYKIFEKIRFVTENLVSQENRYKAYELCNLHYSQKLIMFHTQTEMILIPDESIPILTHPYPLGAPSSSSALSPPGTPGLPSASCPPE